MGPEPAFMLCNVAGDPPSPANAPVLAAPSVTEPGPESEKNAMLVDESDTDVSAIDITSASTGAQHTPSAQARSTTEGTRQISIAPPLQGEPSLKAYAGDARCWRFRSDTQQRTRHATPPSGAESHNSMQESCKCLLNSDLALMQGPRGAIL